MRSQSDALVFFGATGDLAYKKIFPALQDMVRRKKLDVPVIGVARSGWNLDQLKERARASLTEHGGLEQPHFDKLMSLLQAGFPKAQMMVCGVLGPKSNAHGPNEFLHVPYGKKLTAAVAQVVAACP